MPKRKKAFVLTPDAQWGKVCDHSLREVGYSVTDCRSAGDVLKKPIERECVLVVDFDGFETTDRASSMLLRVIDRLAPVLVVVLSAIRGNQFSGRSVVDDGLKCEQTYFLDRSEFDSFVDFLDDEKDDYHVTSARRQGLFLQEE